MKVAIIGRSEILYETAIRLHETGHTITSILTAKAAPEYSKNELDFQTLADKLCVPYKCTSKISTEGIFVRSGNPDIAVSVNFPGIIPSDVIDLFPHGILNAHGGDLPRYRGNACQAWAILQGEERIGLCIHKMFGDELDSGDIIEREYLLINNTTKITEVYSWMQERIPIMMSVSLSKLRDNANYVLEKQSLDPKDVIRCYPRNSDDGRINWRFTAEHILRLINASNKPYSGAFCFHEECKVIIWDAKIVEYPEKICAVPGQIISIGPDCVDVACGDGILRILEIQVNEEIFQPNSVINSIRQRFK